MQRLFETINRYLIYLLTAYVLVDYLVRNTGLSFLSSSWDELLFILIIGVWILLSGVKRAHPIGGKLVIPLMLFYTVVFLIFFIKKGETSIALMELRAIIEYTFWFFIGLNLVQDRQQAKNVCDIFLVVGLVVALYGIYQYVAGVEIPASWVDKAEGSVRSRAFSFLGSPNVLGSFLILHITIAFSSFMAARHWLKKRVYLGTTAISFLALVFTLSRAAWLVFALAFLLLALWLDKRIILALLLLAVITPIAVPSVGDRVAYMMSPEYAESSAEGGRVARWSKAAEYWRAEPATGLGLGKFGGGVAIFAYPDSAYSVDNYYLKIGTEMGYIGLLAFLFLLLSGIRQGKKALDNVQDPYLRLLGTGIFVGLLAILGHNLVENMFERPLMATYFWFFLGILIAFPMLDKVREEEGYEET